MWYYFFYDAKLNIVNILYSQIFFIQSLIYSMLLELRIIK